MDPEPPASSGGTITGGHIPVGELRITPFTPSKQHMVSHLDTIIFYKSRNTITRTSEKQLKMGTQADVVIFIEETIMEGTKKYPKIMASVNIVAAHSNTDNVD